MGNRKTSFWLNRRKFLGLFLQSTLATALVGRSRGKTPQYYTPQSNLDGEWQVTPDPALPNVLLIGDSISIGYTLDVRRLLRGKANVLRPMTIDGKEPDNCGDTRYGLENIHRWVGETKWSVIHFNWGLHDLCYRSPQSKLYGNRDKIHGVLQVPPMNYMENLEQLVKVLRDTKAALIWATTTAIPPNEAGRFTGDEVKYNRIAAKIMRRHHIQIDDLYSLTRQFPVSSFVAPGDVHFTAKRYERVAEQVASSIGETLQKSRSHSLSDSRSVAAG